MSSPACCCCGAGIDLANRNSRWTSRASPFSRFEILRSSSRSIGDAMRDLDARAILTGDFLVVYGDIISNLPLETAIAAHRERKAKDKNAIMTMVLRQAGAHHRTKDSQGNSPVFVIDPTKDRCLHYEQMRPKQSSHFVNLDPEILSTHPDLEIRQDLLDCGIDICTPDVLALWSDNFDYEAPRKGFLHSVLKDYELNGKTIHTHIVNEHYAGRAKNLRAYDAVSKDVVGRWAYPICPDTNLVRDQTYRFTQGNIYREENIILSRSCTIGNRTVIGKATAVGDGTVITNSVIGRRCIVGRNVKIDGAYIWDDATVGDGSVVQDAIVANEASVGKRCKVLPGALISYGVHIADGVTVKEGSRITRFKRKRGYEEDEIVRGENDPKVVGSNGEGFEYADSEEEEDEEAPGIGPAALYNLSNVSLSSESISTLNSEEEWSEGGDHHARGSRSSSFISIASDDSTGGKQAVDFHHDAATSVFDSLVKGDESANIQLELTALRMAADASPHQIRRAVVAAFMKRIATLMENGQSAAQAVKATIPLHQTLLERTMYDRGEQHAEKVDQVDFLILMQTDLCHRKDGEKIMLMASNELVMEDVMEAEGFEQWYEDERSSTGEDMVRIRGAMKPFMDALDADEESESEEDDDESDEDDD